MPIKEHWEEIYSTRSSDYLSRFQAHAGKSLWLIRDTGTLLSASIIDVGGGASTLAGGQRQGAAVHVLLSPQDRVMSIHAPRRGWNRRGLMECPLLRMRRIMNRDRRFLPPGAGRDEAHA